MRHARTLFASIGWTIAGAGLLAGLLAGCSKSPAELETKFRTEGRHYLSEGKSNEAIIEFQNLLKVNPRSASGHYWLGKAYLKKGWTLESVQQFKEASKEDPLLLGAHLELARYGVNSSQWMASKPEIAAILKIDPDNALGWAFSGERALALGHEKEAQRDLEHALALKSGSVWALVAMGDLKRHQNHQKQATDFYRRALKRNPGSSAAWTGLGALARTQGDLKEAARDFKLAVASDPSDLRSQITLSNSMAQQGHLHRAIRSLEAVPAKAADLRVTIKIAEYETVLGENARAIRSLHPLERQRIQIPDIDFVLATAYMQDGQKRQALAMIDRLMAMGGVPPFMKISAARISLIEGDPDETRKILATLKGIPHLPLDYWLVKEQMEVRHRDRSEAVRTIGEGLARFPGAPPLLLAQADVDGLLHQDGAAMSSLNLLLKKDPGNTDAIARMGIFIGKARGARAEIRYYRDNARKSPDNPALETLAILSMATDKQFSAAIRESGTYLSTHPKNNAIRFLLSLFYTQTGRRDLAIQTDKLILVQEPDNLRTLLDLAGLDITAGHVAEAESLYRRALAVSPENANIYAALGRALEGENRIDEARAAFTQALATNPVLPSALLELAKTDILAGHDRQALTHLAPLMDAHVSGRETAELNWLWGLAAENGGSPKSAGDALEKAVRLDPGNYVYHASLGDFWSAGYHWKRALEEYGKSLALRPDNPLLAIKKDWVKVRLAKGSPPDPDLVRNVAKRAEAYRQAHPDEITSGLIGAEARLILRDSNAALAAYDGILSRHPDNQTALMGKAGILLEQGHADEGRAIVENLLATHPDNIQGNLVMASIDRNANNTQGEAAHLVRIYRIHPDWLQTGLSLAAAEIRLQRFSEARSIAFAAHEAHPDLTAPLALLAGAEMGLKKYRQALRDYRALLPTAKNPGVLYSVMSVAARGVGDRPREKHYLELALRYAPDNPVILNNMAFYLAASPKGLPEALGYARKAVRLDPQPFIQDTVGYILFRMADYSRAEEHFKKAYSAHFRDPEFLYHMGMNEWKMGQNSQASLHLKKSVGSGTLSPGKQRSAREALGKLSSGG